MLPPRSVTLLAKATLVALANFRDEAIVRLVRLKTTGEVHHVDLFALKITVKCLYGYTVLESRYDPVDCEGAACNAPARFFEFEGIGLELGWTLLPRSIVAPFFQHQSIQWKVQLGRYHPTRIW